MLSRSPQKHRGVLLRSLAPPWYDLTYDVQRSTFVSIEPRSELYHGRCLLSYPGMCPHIRQLNLCRILIPKAHERTLLALCRVLADMIPRTQNPPALSSNSIASKISKSACEVPADRIHKCCVDIEDESFVLQRIEFCRHCDRKFVGQRTRNS